MKKNDNLRDWCTYFQTYVGTTKLRTGNRKYTTRIMCLNSPCPWFFFHVVVGFRETESHYSPDWTFHSCFGLLGTEIRGLGQAQFTGLHSIFNTQIPLSADGAKVAGQPIIYELVTGLTLALPTLCQTAFSSTLHSLEMRRRPCLFLFLWRPLFTILGGLEQCLKR